MAKPDQDPRNRHGLIPVLIALRVQGERERREKEAARKAGTAPDKPKKKRGWFG